VLMSTIEIPKKARSSFDYRSCVPHLPHQWALATGAI